MLHYLGLSVTCKLININETNVRCTCVHIHNKLQSNASNENVSDGWFPKSEELTVPLIFSYQIRNFTNFGYYRALCLYV